MLAGPTCLPAHRRCGRGAGPRGHQPAPGPRHAGGESLALEVCDCVWSLDLFDTLTLTYETNQACAPTLAQSVQVRGDTGTRKGHV